jgi:hypothetical protein
LEEKEEWENDIKQKEKKINKRFKKNKNKNKKGKLLQLSQFPHPLKKPCSL